MATRVSSPTFVGRRRELDLATAAVARAREGQPAVVLVAGEAGVGKTRFAQEVASRARGSGFRVLVGGCVQLGGEGLPFGAVIEALRGLVRSIPAVELESLVGPGRAELARLMPDLAAVIDRAPGPGSLDGSAQGRLFEHLLRLLERLAERGPVLLVTEDIHWADRSTLELLDFLVRNLREGSIMLLATYRNDELHRRHPLLPFLAEIERLGRVERLALGRFDRADVARQLEGILGARPEPELVDHILARSEGNPFYAEELLAGGSDQGRLPETLREVLLARVAMLSEPTQELLRVASAAGPRIASTLLATVTASAEPALDERLREAVAHQILVPLEEAAGGRYAFRHALVQEAVYGDLLPGERPRLHAAFALALADEGKPDRDAFEAAELAYHWQAAHDLPRAFDAWIVAGVAADAIYAFADAGAHFERALALWHQVPDAPARAPLDRVELLTHAAAALEGTAPRRSVAYIQAAIALIDPAAEPTRAGLLHERLGQYLSHQIDGPNAPAAYREAVRLVPAAPPSAARARVLGGLGRYLLFMHRHAESAALCQEALEVARSVGAREEESRALIWLGADLVALGDVETGIATLRRARQMAGELGDDYSVAMALVFTSGRLELAGRYEAAVTAGFEADAYAARHGLAARFGSSGLVNAAEALIMLGRWDEAARALDRAQRYGGANEPNVEAELLLLEALRGQFESAGRRAPHVRTSTRMVASWLAVPSGLAELALWQGDPLAARKAIRAGAAAVDAQATLPAFGVGWTRALGLRAEADLAEIARASRSEAELGEARAIGSILLAQMRSLKDDVAAHRPYYTSQAYAWLTTCEAEFSRLESAPDPERWAAAATAWEGFRMPYFRAYALMREAEASLSGAGDRRRAVSALTAARAIAVSLGADPLCRAVDDIAARAVGTPGHKAQDASGQIARVLLAGEPHRRRTKERGIGVRSRDVLTPRERDVLALVAAGRSDGEIAQALFITKKTASSHVAHIKDKLGAQSRVEIAMGAIGLGLVEARPGPV